MTRTIKRVACAVLSALLVFGGSLAEEGIDANEQAAIEAQQQAEQEAREQAEREAREKAEQEAREKAEQEAKEKAEQEAKEKAEREAREKAEQEAKEKAEQAARDKADSKEVSPEIPTAAPKEETSKEDPETSKDKAEETSSAQTADVSKEKAAKTSEEAPEEVSETAPAEVMKDRPEADSAEHPAETTDEKTVETPEAATPIEPENPPADASPDETTPVDATESEETSPASANGATADASKALPEVESEDGPIPVPAEAADDPSTEAPAVAPPETSEVSSMKETERAEQFAADAFMPSSPDGQAAPPNGETTAPTQIALPQELASEVETAPAIIAITPEVTKKTAATNGVYQIMPGKKVKLSIPWHYEGDCTGYRISVIDEQGNVVTHVVQTDPAITLELSAYESGSYAMIVEAVSNDSVVAWGRYDFAIASGSGFPGGFPGGGFPGGGFPGGGFSRRGGSGGAPDGMTGDESQGFRVNPGEALTSAHSVGTKDLQRYGAVSLTLSDDEMTELVLGGTALGIVLDGGLGRFTASIDGSRLTLTAEGGKVWSFNGRALRILSDSGIDRLLLKNGISVHDLATSQSLTGDVYAQLRAEGVVSSDCHYRVSDFGTHIFVNGQTYRLDDTGALIPIEGDENAETMADSTSGAA